MLTIGLLAGGAALVGGVMFLVNQPAPVQSQSGYQNGFDAGATAGAQDANATATTSDQTSTTSPDYSTYWSPDLTHSATISSTNQVEFYANQAKKPFKTIQLAGSTSYISAQWSPNNQQIALLIDSLEDMDIITEIWDVNSAQRIFTLPVTSTQPTVVWSPNGQYLAVGYSDLNQDDTFALFNADNGKRLLQKTFSLQAVTSLAWTPDSQYVLFPTPTPPDANLASSWVIEVWSSQNPRKVGTIADSNSEIIIPFTNLVTPLMEYSPLLTFQEAIWPGLQMENISRLPILKTT